MNEPGGAGQTGRIRALLSHLARPADDWAYQGAERRPSVLSAMMVLLLCLLAATAVLTFAAIDESAGRWVSVTLSLLFLAVSIIVVILMIQVRLHLVQPLSQLYAWALRMCDGDFEARIPSMQQGRFAKLSYHINRLSEALDRLANEMDDVVWEQTARLHRKNRSIELLYEIATSVSGSDRLEEILERATERLMKMLDARGARVFVVQPSGAVESIRELGSFDEAAPDGAPVVEHPSVYTALQHSKAAGFGSESAAVHVPLRYQDRTLGQIRLFFSAPALADEEDTLELLDNVGKHLGMAITKFRLDEESRHLVLMRERSSLAYELHDSLAQTIAALRFQISNLTQTVERGDVALAHRELRRIHSSLDEVNTEVRELIANFRAPMRGGGLLESIKNMVTRFEGEAGIRTHFHPRCAPLMLPSAAEMQILGITREALTNIRKHSRASSVRVLLDGGDEQGYRLLIEDDGVGISAPVVNGHPGEHIGLSIMRERAERLGGELKIESESGEGTRIELVFEGPVDGVAVRGGHAGSDL